MVVLDDVTPQYLKASHALTSCSTSFDAALKSLLESEAHQSAGAQSWLAAAGARMPALENSTGAQEL